MQKLSRLLAFVLVGDGLIAVAWGRSFIAWQRRIAPSWYKPVLSWLFGWPESLLHLGAGGEVIL